MASQLSRIRTEGWEDSHALDFAYARQRRADDVFDGSGVLDGLSGRHDLAVDRLRTRSGPSLGRRERRIAGVAPPAPVHTADRIRTVMARMAEARA